MFTLYLFIHIVYVSIIVYFSFSLGEALNKHLNRIIPALITALTGPNSDFESAESVILSVQKEPGPAFLIEELVKGCRETHPETRATAMRLLRVLSSKSSTDLTEHVPQLMIFTTESLNDPSEEVCEEAWLALEAIVKVSFSHNCNK